VKRENHLESIAKSMTIPLEKCLDMSTGERATSPSGWVSQRHRILTCKR